MPSKESLITLNKARTNNLLQKILLKNCKEILLQGTKVLQIHAEKK